MDSRFWLRLAVATALILGVAAPGAAADPVPLGGSPLNVLVGERGQLQAFRVDRGDHPGIFYDATKTMGDAGFFLAFPATNKVYGFDGTAGPGPPCCPALDDYIVGTQDGVTGSGTAGSPLTQKTTYSVPGPVEITQTTTYVNGSQEFRVRWVVHNGSGAGITFKAIAAADFFFEGDDAGLGIFTQGPPRFIGGTNADSGSSGGFVEVLGGPSQEWSRYQALSFPDIWNLLAGAGGSTDPTFNNGVLDQPADNAGAVEWDQNVTTPLDAGANATFDLIVRSAVPSALQLNPTNAASRQGVPVGVTATATDSNGQPYAGNTLRYTITGANAGTGSATLGPTGSAVMTDPGTNAGTDTITAFVDFNGNETRDPVEPQASALATFVDSVPPTCSLKASGTLVGGGGSGKPLTITVNCGEGATVTVLTSMEVLGGRSAGQAAAAPKKKKKKRIRIKLKVVKRNVTAGKPVPIKLKVPKAVARRYAGRRVRLTIKVTARDAAGNVKRIKRTRTAKLAAPKKKRHRRR